jgi:hypothetical protein
MHSNSYLKSKNSAYTFNSEIDFEKINTTKKKSQQQDVARQKLNPVTERETLDDQMAEASSYNSHGQGVRLTTVLSERSQYSNFSSNFPEFLSRRQEGQVGLPHGKASRTARHPSGTAISARHLYYQIAEAAAENNKT